MADTKQEELNFDDMSLEDIRALAEQESTQVEEPETAQPRDEKGRFTKAAEDEPADEPVVFRRVIDLGEGAGKEVFEAESLEDLLDKVVEAKRNASQKIREQAEALRRIEAEKQKAEEEQRQLTDDEEAIISMEMMSHPSQAVKKIFKQMTGIDITEFKSVAERAKALEAAQAEQAEAKTRFEQENAFAASHPEYVGNEKNGKRMYREMNALRSEYQAQGKDIDYPTLLEQAFSNLREDGLLELKVSEDVTADVEPAGATQRRIGAVEEVVPVQRRKASNLTSRGRVMVTPKANVPTEDELYSMPLEQLRELAEKQARGK